MTRAELREAVVAALLSVVPEATASQLSPSAALREQLDIDSMDFVNFVIALDESLGVDVPEADYGRLASLDACVDYLAPKLGIAAQPS